MKWKARRRLSEPENGVWGQRSRGSGPSPGSSPARRAARTLLLLFGGGLLVVLVVGGLLLPVPGWGVGLVVVLALALLGLGWVLIGRNVRRWGYVELDEDLWITRGHLLRRLVVVPYGRMQYVDVQAGPLDRVYGIAQVRLHTASPGTTAYLPGLPAAEAARLRDRLTSLGEAQAAGL